ncbi:MAG TPA: hypothetical protein PK128_03295 [Bacillota bacterium]|nr:hypothetical protein [Bacillota bacterium]HQD17695.1 hypothetical protein [Bacillota bacterium]
MASTGCHRANKFLYAIIFALILAFPLAAVADEDVSSTADPDSIDSIIQGFVDLVTNLDDISTTIIQVPAKGSNSLALSGRVMYSRSQNMLSFSLVDHPLLGGLTLVLDNNDSAVYFVSPSSAEAFKMPAELAAAQLAGLGLGTQCSDSLMVAFEQMLPISVLSNFNLEPMGHAQNDGKDYCLLKATPKDNGTDGEERSYDYAVIWVDPDNFHLCRLEQFSGEESKGAFLLVDSSYNCGLTKADFMAPLQGKGIVEF